MLAKVHKGRVKLPALMQPKLDGVRAHYVDGRLLSRNGKPLAGAASIEAELRATDSLPELDGELYIHGESFQTIVSIARRANHARQAELEYHVFDIVDEHQRQVDRLSRLSTLCLPTSCILVETKIALQAADVQDYLSLCLKLGYEGIMLRNPSSLYQRKRTSDLLKLKPSKLIALVVLDSLEEISIDGYRKNSLGALICKDPTSGMITKVGTGFTAQDRAVLWAYRHELPGQAVSVKYQEKTDGGALRFPVYVGGINVQQW